MWFEGIHTSVQTPLDQKTEGEAIGLGRESLLLGGQELGGSCYVSMARSARRELGRVCG
jgi:hypothetical protein